MRVHVTRKRILGTLAAVGVALTVAASVAASIGEPLAVAAGSAVAEVAATAAALIGESVHAQRRGLGVRGGVGVTIPLWTIDLTDGQQAQVERVREAAAEATAAVRDEMREARQALAEAVRSEVVDESRIRALAARVASLEADALVRRAHVQADIWQLLTPEQQDQVREMRERRSERFAEGRDRIHNRRRP